MNRKKAVLIINLGTPDEPSRGAVYRYLKQFLLDPRVIDYSWLPRNLLVRGIIAPFRSGSSSKLYKRLWTENGSPLKHYGYLVEKGVQEALGDSYDVKLAMRYQNPSIEKQLDALLKNNPEELIIFPMFPQYASATSGSVIDEVMRLLRKKQSIPSFRWIADYFNNDDLLEIYANNARQFDLNSYDHFIFSYHGLPQRQLRRADQHNYCLKSENCCQNYCQENRYCYSAQCYQTTQKLVDKLSIEEGRYTTTFQSRLGPEKWTQPYTIKVLEDLAGNGAKRILVFSPAFVADCLETTIEIGFEYQEEFHEWGGEKIDLVPSLNDDPAWIKVISDLIKEPQANLVSHES